MLRTTLTVLATCFALPAAALCSGDSFLTQLEAEDRAAIAETTAAVPFSEGLLWSLTKDDKTLTIVGTMHVYDTRLEDIRNRVRPALQSADLLMVEATAEEEQAMQEAFVASPDLYLITEGPTLPDLLGDDLWPKVQQAAADRGLPGFMIAQMQPWYLSLTLGIPACAMADLAAGQRGLDHMLIQDAEAADVPLQALESWEVLIGTLSDSTMEEQLAALEMSLLGKEDQQAMFVALLDLYFAEQSAAVWTLSEIAARELTDLSEAEVAEQMAETQDVLLNQRNLNWIPVIEAATATYDDIVLAFGAAHIPGDLGVIALLEAEGWTATRLP
jgi:uncharacterized protein YbaP (TraB family)